MHSQRSIVWEFPSQGVIMDEVTLMRIKQNLERAKAMDLDIPTNVDKVMDFYCRVMPVLLAEIDKLQKEVERLNIKYRIQPFI